MTHDRSLVCPTCFDVQNGAAQVTGPGENGDVNFAPSIGDVGICINCGEIFTVLWRGTRTMTETEKADLPMSALTASAMIKLRGRVRRSKVSAN